VIRDYPVHKQSRAAEVEPEGQAGTRAENAAGQHSETPEDKLQALRAERATLMDRLARQQAEFENARKRSLKAQAEFREYALADVAKSLLPVLDSLERALEHNQEAKDFISGVQLIHRQLQGTMNKMGVKQIATEGEQFNPELHEAVEVVESDAEGDRVLGELQRGYTFKDRLLRPAMVRVSRRK
jgi:molecular chaperone GrpE